MLFSSWFPNCLPCGWPLWLTELSVQLRPFIEGRCILDGPLALHEIIHELKVKNLSVVPLKLDFEKAYDRVNWLFLREVLLKKAFEVTYVNRIMQLVLAPISGINME